MARSRFEDRYPELWQLAYRAAYRITGSRERSEDIAQAALERALRSWWKVHDRSEPWVVRVATNLALDGHRHEAVVDRAAARGDAGADQLSAGADEHFEVHLAMRAALGDALAALPDRQRSAVVLRHLYGYSVQETATTLRISTGSVKTHTHRGLAAMRALLPDTARSLLGEEDDP